MIEFAHELTVWFENGTASAVFESYDKCWEVAGLAKQEAAYWFQGAGEWIGARCVPTETLTQVPAPEMRP